MLKTHSKTSKNAENKFKISKILKICSKCAKNTIQNSPNTKILYPNLNI